MTNRNSLILISIVVLISTSLYSCADDDVTVPFDGTMTNSEKNISQLVMSDKRIDSLEVALNEANLAITFDGATNYTIFAPNNQAFVDLLASDSTLNRISDIDAITLTNLLYYHVSRSVLRSSDFNDDAYVTTINTQGTATKKNTVFEVDITGGSKLNNSAKVEEFNIKATNGFVHVIDQILKPQNVVELAVNDERFSSLVSALTLFGDSLTGALSGRGPFTVFAPTNAAFQSLLDSNPAWMQLSDIPRATLRTVLEYHVIAGSNVRAEELRQSQALNTLSGGRLTVNLMNGAQLETSNSTQASVNIVVTNVQGTNGVVHAVDQVLLP